MICELSIDPSLEHAQIVDSKQFKFTPTKGVVIMILIHNLTHTVIPEKKEFTTTTTWSDI